MEPVIYFNAVDKPYGWMGNMSPYPVIFKDQKWLTIEALFQSLRFDDEMIISSIRNEKSPMSAKMVAKKYKEQMTLTPMSEHDVENMKCCLRLKFDQYPVLKEKLLKTKSYTIIEDIGNRNGERHLFWGMKRNSDNQWEGNNRMGKLLMELRDEFRL